MTRSKKRNKKPTIVNQPLLIAKYKSEIINKVKNNKIVIIVGQTGCGKSTQVPQYLHDNRTTIGLKPEGKIACLHPRSVAAISLAERVAYETRTVIGTDVGFRVRFYKEYNDNTRIVYMTAGFMLRLLTNPQMINDYNVVIVDEVHERLVQNDLVMGQMRLLMATNDSLRLVIMSATMNVAEIKQYYPEAVIVQIAPIKDKVDIIYRSVKGSDYVLTVCEIVGEILRSSDKGDILVFLPSEDKIQRCKQLLKGINAKVLPLYGAMDYKDKMAVFREYNKRKVVVSTNIAETSLTIDGVYFVVDAGFVKRVHYEYETRVDRWVTERVSVAEAEQRKGRTGRTSDGRGTCYRLYGPFSYSDELTARLGDPQLLASLEGKYSVSELRIAAENLDSLIDVTNLDVVCDQIDKILASRKPKKDAVSLRYPVPEMCTTNLDSTILWMLTMRLEVETFPFIVAPKADRIKASIAHLKALSLLEDNGTVTPLGHSVASLPLDPTLGKVAVLAAKQSCREDVFIILALLSSSSLLKRWSSKNRTFWHGDGDLFMMLNVFCEAEAQFFDGYWCYENGVIFSSIKFARLVFWQLCRLLPSPFGKRSSRLLYPEKKRVYDTKLAFLSGFFENLSVREGKSGYRMTEDKRGTIYQHSCVAKTNHCVLPLFNHSSQSSQQVIMKQCTVYDLEMLNAVNPREWRIRVNLWYNMMDFLMEKQKK